MAKLVKGVSKKNKDHGIRERIFASFIPAWRSKYEAPGWNRVPTSPQIQCLASFPATSLLPPCCHLQDLDPEIQRIKEGDQPRNAKSGEEEIEGRKLFCELTLSLKILLNIKYLIQYISAPLNILS